MQFARPPIGPSRSRDCHIDSRCHFHHRRGRVWRALTHARAFAPTRKCAAPPAIVRYSHATAAAAFHSFTPAPPLRFCVSSNNVFFVRNRFPTASARFVVRSIRARAERKKPNALNRARIFSFSPQIPSLFWVPPAPWNARDSKTTASVLKEKRLVFGRVFIAYSLRDSRIEDFSLFSFCYPRDRKNAFLRYLLIHLCFTEKNTAARILTP